LEREANEVYLVRGGVLRQGGGKFGQGKREKGNKEVFKITRPIRESIRGAIETVLLQRTVQPREKSFVGRRLGQQ